jgi:hypothetical protein
MSREIPSPAPEVRPMSLRKLPRGVALRCHEEIEFSDPRGADPWVGVSQFESRRSIRARRDRAGIEEIGFAVSGSRESRGSRSRSLVREVLEIRVEGIRVSGFRSAGFRRPGFRAASGYQPIVLPGESLSKYRNRPVVTFPPATKAEEATALRRH